jgi:uncharacterized protein YggE
MAEGPERSTPDPGTIVVGGTGQVTVTPDVADVRLGVAITRPTAAAARAEAASVMTAILAAAEDAGAARSDVRTSTLSLQPRYDYRDGRAPTLTGYELANTAEITVRDLARLGAVIDGSLAAGATSMDGLSFRVADPAVAEREARLAAMAAARAKADVLAEAAGLTIRGVLAIVEGPPAGAPGPRFKAERLAMAADVPTPVEAGSTDISVSVTVTFAAG